MDPVDRAVDSLLDARTSLLGQLAAVNQALHALGRDGDGHLDRRRAGGATVRRLRPDGARAAILELLDARRRDAFDRTAIQELIEAGGWHTASPDPRHVVASTLARMERSGEVERTATGRYRLAGTGGLELVGPLPARLDGVAASA